MRIRDNRPDPANRPALTGGIAECLHCGSLDVIIGDGPRKVCKGCIADMGAAVADPLSIPARIRLDLLEAHLDVVDLFRGQWRWTGWA